MADNVNITPGTGNTVAADEVVDGTLGTVKVQYVKLMDGVLDSTTKISPATSAKQDTGNTSLSSIDGKLPAQGQALAAASVPVVLPTAQITTLTPPSAITGYALDATLTGGTAKAIATDGTNSVSIATAGADGTSNTFNGLRTSAHLKVFNGTTWDRMAGDTTGISVKSHAVTNAGTFAVQAASSTATASAVPANAYYQGVNAQTALPTAASAGNLTGVTADKFGRTVTIPGTLRDLVGTQTTTIAASTAETTIVTAAASVFNDLTALVVSNTSATATRLDFRDTTAGSVLFSLYIPSGDVRGVAFNRPVPQTTTNTNWTAQSSASITDLRVYAVFDKNR